MGQGLRGGSGRKDGGSPGQNRVGRLRSRDEMR